MDLTKLMQLDSTSLAWEVERQRLIDEVILSAPLELRSKLEALQINLDKLRETMTTEQFLRYLLSEIRENLENLDDQLLHLKHTLL